MATRTGSIDQHPDIVALRDRYEQAAETPQAQLLDGLTFLGGLYVAISPWVVGFSSAGALAVSNLVTGIALAVLAMGYAGAHGRMHRLAWVAPLIGVWTIITPWVILQGAATTGMVISNVITGGVVTLLGLGVAAIGMTGRSRRSR
ncbi:SPW repeat-containing protein [Prauserella shujinwangii]|uniref:SPW repeat-containing protein n=1 Tax=Prauserella shujinwangii TaxID=1453103 RepID=A0A2T0LSB9_9PSEU|nr:SPW repeat protein [Prauserella shujinwangii]PRX46567.1 SPW repeat-containing protein [Prauserella shujinwangii]